MLIQNPKFIKERAIAGNINCVFSSVNPKIKKDKSIIIETNVYKLYFMHAFSYSLSFHLFIDALFLLYILCHIIVLYTIESFALQISQKPEI